jgi:hypothetical protein
MRFLAANIAAKFPRAALMIHGLAAPSTQHFGVMIDHPPRNKQPFRSTRRGLSR